MNPDDHETDSLGLVPESLSGGTRIREVARRSLVFFVETVASDIYLPTLFTRMNTLFQGRLSSSGVTRYGSRRPIEADDITDCRREVSARNGPNFSVSIHGYPLVPTPRANLDLILTEPVGNP